MTLIAQAGSGLEPAINGEFSFLALFSKAGWVVKGVMLILSAALKILKKHSGQGGHLMN